jgi:hypothetical protein
VVAKISNNSNNINIIMASLSTARTTVCQFMHTTLWETEMRLHHSFCPTKSAPAKTDVTVSIWLRQFIPLQEQMSAIALRRPNNTAAQQGGHVEPRVFRRFHCHPKSFVVRAAN